MIKPIVFTGPSGVGKSSVINELMTVYPTVFAILVSYTTRLPRKGEVEGKDYYYVSTESFKDMIQSEEFIEYAYVHGNYYGSPKQQIYDLVAQNKVPILDIDIQGVKNLLSD